jgi:hypothetical protein
LHAGLGEPLAEGRWPGYSKRFLSSVDAAMIVKPDERPQSISEWLPMFGREIESEADDADEATRFYAKQVHTEEIKPVAPTPNPDTKPVETGVPASPKEAEFKRAGEETGASKKKAVADKPAEEPQKAAGDKAAAATAAAAPAVAAKAPKSSAPPAKKKLSPVMIGGAAAALAMVGIGAFALRGGGGNNSPQLTTSSQPVPPVASESTATQAALGTTNATAATNQAATASQNTAAPAAPQPSEQTNTVAALKAEQAKSAAAEAQLAALKKAAAKAAATSALPKAPVEPKSKADRKAAALAQAGSSGSQTGGVSPAKMAQFDATVDDARSMAKQVMRSSNKQNADMAKNYDKYLKTLKDSMRGIQSDKEADKLIKQANQTRAYIQYLVRQGQ